MASLKKLTTATKGQNEKKPCIFGPITVVPTTSSFTESNNNKKTLSIAQHALCTLGNQTNSKPMK